MSYTYYNNSDKLLPLWIRSIRTIKRLSIGPGKGRESYINGMAIRRKDYVTLQSINNLNLNRRLIDAPSKKWAISSLSYKAKAKKHPAIVTRSFTGRVSGYIQVARAARLRPVTIPKSTQIQGSLNPRTILGVWQYPGHPRHSETFNFYQYSQGFDSTNTGPQACSPSSEQEL